MRIFLSYLKCIQLLFVISRYNVIVSPTFIQSECMVEEKEETGPEISFFDSACNYCKCFLII